MKSMLAGFLIEQAGGGSRRLSPGLSKNKWLAAGLVVAAVIALLCTFCTHSVAHAQDVHVQRLAPPGGPGGDGGQQDASPCGAATLEDCLMQPVTLKNNSKIQNPLQQGNSIFFITPAQATVGSDQVKILWHIMLYIVDAFSVLVLMFNGLKIILGGTVFRYADAVEIIPGMLLALVAAHISMLIIAFFLGLNNTLSADLYNMVADNTTLTPTTSGINQTDETLLCQIVGGVNTFVTAPIGGATPIPTIAGDHVSVTPAGSFLVSLIPACQMNTEIISHVQVTPTNVSLPNILDTLSTLTGIGSLMIQILGLMMMAQIMIRLFFVNLYIIFAPIGIACWALPGKAGQPLTRMWLHGFISTVMVQFVQVVALIITQLMLGAVAHNFAKLPGMDPHVLVEILEISVLWFILRIPNLFNTPSMRTITEAGQAMSQAAGAAIAVSTAEIQGGLQVAGGAISGLLGLIAL